MFITLSQEINESFLIYTVIIIAGLWNIANVLTIISRMMIFARETTLHSNIVVNFTMKLIKLEKMKKKTDVIDLIIFIQGYCSIKTICVWNLNKITIF